MLINRSNSTPVKTDQKQKLSSKLPWIKKPRQQNETVIEQSPKPLPPSAPPASNTNNWPQHQLASTYLDINQTSHTMPYNQQQAPQLLYPNNLLRASQSVANITEVDLTIPSRWKNKLSSTSVASLAKETSYTRAKGRTFEERRKDDVLCVKCGSWFRNGISYKTHIKHNMNYSRCIF
jgi:hypothetical protein